MNGFFAELKRRNVYKVAAAYAVVAWLLIQIATQTFPFFDVPNWTVRLVILLIIAGFPVALICAWAYELTPAGLKKTTAVVPEQSIRRSTGRKLDFFIITVLAIAVAALLVQRLRTRSASSDTAPSTSKTVAVLPFDNLSDDKQNAYFAEGIQDEVLTRLAKVAELKVISRTSTQRYNSKPTNLPEIAAQLGVAHVIEGTVQRAGGKVRVNVQLIKASTDEHLWGETYDRDVIDIFTVESDIATSIAEQLRARLTGREQQAIAAKPTQNADAYDEYLRGLAIWTTSVQSPIIAREAAGHFQRAVEIDPSFSAAWAHLSIVHSRIFYAHEATAAQRARAHQAVERAVALQSDSAETLLAQGYVSYWVDADFGKAAAFFRQVQQLQPGSAEPLVALSYIARRRGNLSDALAQQLRVLELDPRNPTVSTQLSVTYNLLRRFSDAHAAVTRALNITPDDPQLHAGSAILYYEEGNVDAALEAIRGFPPTPELAYIFEVHVRLAWVTGQFDRALDLINAALADPGTTGYRACRYRYLLGFTQQLAGDPAAARHSCEDARRCFEQYLLGAPEYPEALMSLAFVCALLGDKDSAVKAAKAAIAARPTSEDAVRGPAGEEMLARVYAWVGMKDEALTAVEHLLKSNDLGPEQIVLTPAVLRLDPVWQPLRGDPRYQQLIAGTTPR